VNKPSGDHSLWRRCELHAVRIKDGHFLFVGEETYEAGAGTFIFLPHVVPHSYTFEIDEVRMIAIVAPGA
jgi:hypothetical protein